MKTPSAEGRRLRQLLPALRQLLAGGGLGFQVGSDHIIGPGGAADETSDVILIHEPGFVTLLPKLAALDARLICQGLSIQIPSPSLGLRLFFCAFRSPKLPKTLLARKRLPSNIYIYI